jgi:hypothetical protein
MRTWRSSPHASFLGFALALGALACSSDPGTLLPQGINPPSNGGGSQGDDSGGSGVILPGTTSDDGSVGSGPSTGQDAGAASPDAAQGNTDATVPGHDAAVPPDDATTPGVDANPPPVPDSGDPLAAARALCLQIINQDRASLNPPSPPLTEATDQESCVDQQAQKDFEANTAHSAFGQCSEWAQNECPGWGGPPTKVMTDCLKAMWDEGPPPSGQDNHWLNMSNSQYTKVACGFYQTPSGDWWATQDFY